MENQVKAILEKLRDHEERLARIENRKSKVQSNMDTLVEDEDSNNISLAIVNKIGDCPEGESILKMIFGKKDVGPKVLLCFYIAYKYFGNKWLTSGDIERITTELGIKVTAGNVSNKIKSMRSYFESGAVRRNGLPTPYRLNRNGSSYFEGLINGN